MKYAFVRHPEGSYDSLNLPNDLLGEDAEPKGINDSGQVIATTNMTSGSKPMKAILWSNGTVQDLGDLPESTLSGSTAHGINNHGDVVGGSNYEWECLEGFYCWVVMHASIYSNGVMQDLDDLIPSDSGWILEKAIDINDAGQIVVNGRHDSWTYGVVLLTPYPKAMIDNLINNILDFNLPKGIENNLVSKLKNAQAALNVGDTATACELLRAFINETSAQSGKKIDVEDATKMINIAQQIRATIGCP